MGNSFDSQRSYDAAWRTASAACKRNGGDKPPPLTRRGRYLPPSQQGQQSVPQTGHDAPAAQSGQPDAQHAAQSDLVNGQLGSPHRSQTLAEVQQVLQSSVVTATVSAGVARAAFPAQNMPAPASELRATKTYNPRSMKNLPCGADNEPWGPPLMAVSAFHRSVDRRALRFGRAEPGRAGLRE